MTGVPPKCISVTMIPAAMNATPAVMNHPPITEMTPVILNTALSRPHARSASDVPIATMNVTYVVESGSLSDVPAAIKAPASTRFTDPRTRSNAAPFSIITSEVLNRRPIHCLTPCGIYSLSHDTKPIVQRTRLRDSFDEPNISSPTSCRVRLTEVSTTLRAFLDVASETTITTPAPRRK